MSPDDYVAWRRRIGTMVRELLRSPHTPRNTVLLISRHPYTPLDYVRVFRRVPWEHSSLLLHPDMSKSFYKTHMTGDGQFYERHHVRPRTFTAYFQQDTRHVVDFPKWEMAPTRNVFMSYHPKLPISLVVRHVHMGWDLSFLLLYREWKSTDIERLLEVGNCMNWTLFSKNPFLSTEIIERFCTQPWDWKVLAVHPSFPPQEIIKNETLSRKWKWERVFKNPRMSLAFWDQLCATPSAHYTKDSAVILHNTFQYDEKLRTWALFKIHRRIGKYMERKKITEKRKMLLHLKRLICPDIMSSILSFV